MKVLIKPVILADVPMGMAFEINGYQGCFMATTQPSNGIREALNLVEGTVHRVPTHTAVTVYPNAELIIRNLP